MKKLLVFGLVLCRMAMAQQVTGSVTGSVTDPSGGAVAGTQVKVIQSATGLEREMTTDASGDFRFLLLPPGSYIIEASSPGFRTFRREGVVIETDRSFAVPIRLDVGAVTETVDVKGSTPLLEPNTSALGTVMDGRKVDDLPLNGGNPMGFANLVPTVRAIGFFGGEVLSSSRLAAVSIGGGPALSTGIMVDGIASEKMFSSGTMAFPTVGATLEFKVLTNAMSAEFGRTGGGIISVVTKSGTNQFHGNLFEFLRNDKLNANEFFANRAGQPRPALVWNQYGGSVGGPIRRNKLFFFANYEQFSDRFLSQRTTTSPTASQRAGDFSETRTQTGALINIFDPTSTRADPTGSGRFVRDQFPGNRIPSNRINPVGRNVLTYYPLPNLPGLPFTGAQNLFLQGGGPINRKSATGKIDYNLDASRRLSGRYSWDDIDWHFPILYRTPAEPDGRLVLIPRNSSSLQFTDALRPTLLLDAKIGFNRENEHFFTPSEGFDITTLGMPASFKQQAYVGAGADTGRFPLFSVTDLESFGATASRGSPSITTQASVAVTKVTGKHTVKGGFEHRFYSRNDWGRENSVGSYTVNRGFTQGPDPLQSSATAGYGVASLLLGTPASGFARFQIDPTASLRYYALFLQDDWKVTPRLTLNPGLRWEYEGPMTDRYNVISNFDPNLESPLKVPNLALRGGLTYPGVGGIDRGAVERDFNDFGPRLGFAYQARPNLVVRGGFGILFMPSSPIGAGGLARTGFTLDTPMVTTLDGGLTPKDTLSNPFPNGLTEPTGSRLGALTGIGTDIAGQLRGVHRGYSEQWNLTVQYEPWRNWLVETAWIANHGVRLTGANAKLNYISDQNFALGTALAQSVTNPFRGVIPTGTLAGATITRFQSLLPYPQFTAVDGGYSTFNNSIYHALAIKVEKRMARGVSLLAAYTKSKLIDDGQNRGTVQTSAVAVTTPQNWNNMRAERSKSAEDIPQRLVVTAIWDVPLGRGGPGWQRQLLGKWQINGIATIESGRPISLTVPVTGGGNRPNVVPGVDAKLDDPTIARWFNTAAFSTPAAYTYGNVSRTLPNVSSDGMFNLDLSVFKGFPIKNERITLQFRAEAFNLTNSPTFETPGRTLNSATFAVVTATAFTPKPRQIQLALRLVF